VEANGSIFRTVRTFLKRLPFVPTVKQNILRAFNGLKIPDGQGTTNLNIVTTFPLYSPGSTGKYEDLAAFTIEAINQMFPVLSYFARAITGKHIEPLNVRNFPTSAEDLQAADELKTYLDRYGSDKAQKHNYHLVYGPILKQREGVSSILEIGLGTNNLDVVSNMGAAGRPGASLRAFRDFLKEAIIYGGDIDRRILFQEHRIRTYYVDQRDPNSLNELGKLIPSDLDLIIDDGLHSPNANVNTLLFGLKKLKVGGWIVVEDVRPDAIPVWEIVAALLPSNYAPHLFRAATLIYKAGADSLEECGVVLFAVHRLV
jgi:hypothetical protein